MVCGCSLVLLVFGVRLVQRMCVRVALALDVLPRPPKHFPSGYEGLNLPCVPSDDFFSSKTRFSMSQWSECRRALLSFAVARCRGLLVIDNSVVRNAINNICMPTFQHKLEFLQRIAGYFWALVWETPA
jgi:hypothetical protein